jgi:hypothetical protein
LDLDWGSVPGWVGSVLTVTSVLVAVIAYRKRVQEIISDYARQVTAWRDEGTPTVHVKNNSRRAVYAVVLFYPKIKVRRTMSGSPFYGDDDDFEVVAKWYAIPPESEVEVGVEKPLGGPDVPWICFRDAGGRDWIRDYRGNLAQHKFWFQEFFSIGTYTKNRPLRLIVRFYSYGTLDYVRDKLRELSCRRMGRKQSSK